MRVIERTEDNSHESPLISMLQARTRKGDELLLHSGGPVTDLSQKSMLPALDSMRFLFFEPYGEEAPAGSALSGEIHLGNPPPLNLVRQRLIEERWHTEEEYNPATLEEALSIVAEHEIEVELNEHHSITPGGFAGLLGYDLGRWSNSIRLANTPEPGTLLGVLWRCDAWWIHERANNQLRLFAIEGHQWLEQELPKLSELKMPAKLESIVPDSESDSEHARKVEKIRESIRGGHLYPVSYTHLTLPTTPYV